MSMFKVYLVNRTDHRGTFPIKYYMVKESADFFCGEANTAWTLIKNSENIEEDIEVLRQFDPNAEACCSVKYTVEEIVTE